MSKDQRATQTLENTANFLLKDLSPDARTLLDAVVDAWLIHTPPGKHLVRELGHDQARVAIHELLDQGLMIIRTSGEIMDPGTTMRLSLTDYGRAIAEGTVQ
jgi:hypothetical protein